MEFDSSLAVDLITKNKVIIDKNYNLINASDRFISKKIEYPGDSCLQKNKFSNKLAN